MKCHQVSKVVDVTLGGQRSRLPGPTPLETMIFNQDRHKKTGHETIVSNDQSHLIDWIQSCGSHLSLRGVIFFPTNVPGSGHFQPSILVV